MCVKKRNGDKLLGLRFMQRTVFMRRIARPLSAGLLYLVGIAAVCEADTYDIASKQLTMPSLVIGGARYSDVIVVVGKIVSGPTGTSPNGSDDSYDPETNQLTIQTVTVCGSTYYNAVVTVARLVSIGTVTGANTYNGTSLNIPYVQAGGTIYSNAIAAVGSVVSVAGGMPTFATNTYDSFSNQLAIPAMGDQVNNKVYTNVIATEGSVSSAGGIFSSVAESVLHSFSGDGGIVNSTDGAVTTGMLLGRDGNLYGVTDAGGAYAKGSIFKITTAGVESVLYSFTGDGGIAASTDGAGPSSLIHGSDGRFYGTTYSGGAYNEGAVFTVTAAGVEKVIYSFSGNGGITGSTDGAVPMNLMLSKDGSFYGTTGTGGAYGVGTVFRVTRAGVESVLYSFAGGSKDGSDPMGGLTQDHDGNFYGTTVSGGAYGAGTVFKVNRAGAEAILHSFTGGASGITGSTDGAIPTAGLIYGDDRNFYGETFFGGEYGQGMVFRITESGVETVVHSFSGGALFVVSNDGSNPDGGLIEGSDGNLYGTTRYGSTTASGGTIFKITKTGAETVLYSFILVREGDARGAVPELGVIEGSDGTIYGTTGVGGAYDEGVVFKATAAIASQ
jgi:uncharacterized repeat protein (TIGR03803 family)